MAGYYSLQEIVEFTAAELDIPLESKRNVIEAKVIQCLRELPLERFVVKDQTATLNVVNGMVQVPSDVVALRNQYAGYGMTPQYNKNRGTIKVNSALTHYTIHYDGLPKDEQGITLIPEVFDKAIVLYITAEYLMRKGMIEQRNSRADYDYARRDYENELGRTRGKVNALSEQEIANIIFIRRSLLPINPLRRARLY